MTSIEKACYLLIASSFVLAAMLLAALQDRITPQAHATPMLLSRDNLTVMTAKTRVNEESLVILDNASQKLLIYNLDVPKQRMNLSGAIDLAQLFAGPGGSTRGPAAAPGPRPVTPR